ncbi:ecotropic viral integration site 5 ortholog isoform X2 [Notolabrus celidotus]|uniref:ecotropic viral integration site 5 ortholog isoform X2 n=1 Tax=Notolabrus celidotus TaxID=1203425 RepID=UPI0014906F12|nr:ecotropic viral integration site 5 ortholog isoform X2 [Notolabrus celidotus]
MTEMFKMLSPLSSAQKRVNDEDSSGSDAGSEVGPEPETDRFGFILTNGSEAGSVGPAPELVRQREAKWISIISQWDHILLKKASKVKVQCQKGIPASLRAKCWPLLCGATDRMKLNETIYQTLDSQPALQSWVDVIERDLDRQFPFHEMFLSKDGHGQRGLFRVLKAYTQYKPEEGYCQAQGPVAAVLLMNMPAEEAFWCLVQISEQYLPGYYSPLLEGVLFDAGMLSWVLKRTCPAVHKHLQQHGVEPLMFATDWLMCLFTRHLPFNTLLRVWDLFFCFGVRVLLQVSVVLVRRVLGRAEQRRQCEGQMETLERLRGVRDQVQEEDDTFIAEVCSVQLSAKDLEKQTEKQLEKWRKDRPASTFDPRGRCHGYRMAWARARQTEEENNKREREKGNLSVPLTRSASTLSLSPSLLHRWKKGGKANTGEWKGGGKVVRHLSMGASEDWRNCAEFHFKKVKEVQEEEDDVDSDECKKQSELNQREQTAQTELLEVPEKNDTIQNKLTEQEEETVVTEQSEEVEKRINEEDKSQLEEAEQSKMLSEETEGLLKGPAEDQSVETTLHPPEHISHSQEVLEQQSHTSKEQEIQVKESEKQTAESEQPAAVEGDQIQKHVDADSNTEVEMKESVDLSEERMNQTDMKLEERTGSENVHQMQVETAAEISEATSEMDSEVRAPVINDLQEQNQNVITEREKNSQKDACKEEYHMNESSAESDIKEPHTHAETDSDVLVQTPEENTDMQEKVESEDPEQHVDSETGAETVVLCCTETKEGSHSVADSDTKAEIPAANEIVTYSEESEESSEKGCDTVACAPTQEEGSISTVDSEEQLDNNIQAEETPTESLVNKDDTDLLGTQGEEVSPISEPDGETSLTEVKDPVETGPGEQNIEGSEVEKRTEKVEELSVEDDEVFKSTDKTDSQNTDGHPQVQEQDSDCAKEQTEHSNGSQTQACGRCNSRSSGDYVRKSSSSRRSWLGRRLSEDLFIMPLKTQPIPNHEEVYLTEPQPSPGALDPAQPQEVPLPLPAVVTERTSTQQEQQLPDPPKRLGLFRRLRGEQSNKGKQKGTAKIQVPKILIQDFSDGTGIGKQVKEETQEKLSSRERRRRRREQERKEKEEEKLKKRREKELEKERKRPQTRGKSFQGEKDKGRRDVPANTESQTLRCSDSYAEAYF